MHQWPAVIRKIMNDHPSRNSNNVHVYLQSCKNILLIITYTYYNNVFFFWLNFMDCDTNVLFLFCNLCLHIYIILHDWFKCIMLYFNYTNLHGYSLFYYFKFIQNLNVSGICQKFPSWLMKHNLIIQVTLSELWLKVYF